VNKKASLGERVLAGERIELSRERGAVDVMRNYWEGTVEAARAGDVAAARDVLKDFADTVEGIADFRQPEKAWSGPIPWQFAKYLAAAFREILGGAAPGRALNLIGKKRGRRKGKSVTHNMEAVAAAYNLLIRSGVKPEVANEALSSAVGADRSTIHRARQMHQAFAYRKLIDDEILRVAARPYADRIAALLPKPSHKK
jgi:hypothetical protein